MQLAKDSKYKIIQDEDNRQNELMYNCRGNKKKQLWKMDTLPVGHRNFYCVLLELEI